MKPFLYLIICFLLCSVSIFGQTEEGKDCSSAVNIQDKSTISITIKNKSIGNKDDIAGGEGVSCFNKGEKFPYWFSFVANNSGSLEFFIEGSPNTDWDWVIFELNENCDQKKEMRCNAALNTECSETGASTSRKKAYSGCDDSNPWNEDIQVSKGKTYIILINCTDCRPGDGFDLNFGGNVIFHKGN
ncbi:MAG: hypothetical protein ACK4ND_15905 [Cytophagaceae bacterium]